MTDGLSIERTDTGYRATLRHEFAVMVGRSTCPLKAAHECYKAMNRVWAKYRPAELKQTTAQAKR